MSTAQSFIHPDATIGEGVIIEPFSYISADVKVGNGTRIGPHATILDGARIGMDCQVFPGAVISAPPQDLKYQGERSFVIIGDRTIVREHVTINRGTALDLGQTTIGSECLIMAYTHIAHDCVIGDQAILANGVQMAGHVTIGHCAFIGGTVAIHQHSSIGAYAMVSGGCLVRKDVPPFIIAAREPLKYIGVNKVGLQRKGFSENEIKTIGDLYGTIFHSGLNNGDAISILKDSTHGGSIEHTILNFFESSRRGVIRAESI